jgi:hypothetical protein
MLGLWDFTKGERRPERGFELGGNERRETKILFSPSVGK